MVLVWVVACGLRKSLSAEGEQTLGIALVTMILSMFHFKLNTVRLAQMLTTC